MGCLFEIIFEILIAGALEGMMFVSLKFTSILIPEKEFNENNKQKIKNVIVMITVFEFLSVFIGALFLLPPDYEFKIIGKYMVGIPLAIISVQIVMSVIVTVIKMIKKRNNTK